VAVRNAQSFAFKAQRRLLAPVKDNEQETHERGESIYENDKTSGALRVSSGREPSVARHRTTASMPIHTLIRNAASFRTNMKRAQKRITQKARSDESAPKDAMESLHRLSPRETTQKQLRLSGQNRVRATGGSSGSPRRRTR